MLTVVQDFNGTVQLWIDDLDRYSLEALQMLPSDSEWSLGQVYRHLIDEAKFHLENIQQCFREDAVMQGAPTAEGQRMLTRNSFPEIKIVGPMTDVYIPQPDKISVLRNELEQIIDNVLVLSQQYDLVSHAGKSLHPGLGYFTPLEWLRFSEMHFRHHRHQKRRLENFLKDNGLLA